MALLKCKMCGGVLESNGITVATCEYCGTQQTLPKIDDEQRTAAFNRGNHFRRIGEFDKALAVYERIVLEDDSDAEAHWCCALSRFGIEYVEDPATYDWLPTCHRASFDSFLEDVDYQAALEHSDGITKRQYMKDGAKIAEVQRGILINSQTAEPYDIFICYKESDGNGERTLDSLIAQEIYYQLIEQGKRVFFARITLEDVAGTQYEPFIFAALNSAKVMIVVGTKAEHLNAVWVKNEWSRFLAMMKKDHSKLLLPCYRDMDPYDMPEQLAVLQSYDMSKIGFIQDLTRGIAKVLDAQKKPEPAKETIMVRQTANSNIAPFLKRAFMFLEDGDWASAGEYCEKVLDLDPECPEAYLGKLMVELHVKKQDELKDQPHPFDGSNSYQKVLRFGDDAIKNSLEACIKYIIARNEQARLDEIYTRATNIMDTASDEKACRGAAQIFSTIREYKDAADLEKLCIDKANEIIYTQASRISNHQNVYMQREAAQLFTSISSYKDAAKRALECQKTATSISNDEKLYKSKQLMAHKNIQSYKEACQLLESISGWKDADEQIIACQRNIEEIKAKEEAERQRQVEIARKEAERIAKRNKKITIIITTVVCAIIAFFIVLNTVIIPNGKYNDAVALMNDGKYEEAISAFEALDGYKDSEEKIAECNTAIIDEKYDDAIALMNAGKYEDAISAFKALDGYKDSRDKIAQCNTAILDGKYDDAIALMNAGKYEDAISAFKALSGHKDSAEKITQCNTAILDGKYDKAIKLMNAGKYEDAISAFEALDGYRDSEEKIAQCNTAILDGKYDKAIKLMNAGKYEDAISAFEALDGYKESANKITECMDAIYAVAEDLMAEGNFAHAAMCFGKIGDYKDATERSLALWSKISVRESIDTGWRHTAGLKANGIVVAVGENDYGQCDVSSWKDIVAISSGARHTVGLKSDGTVVAVGENDYGQCNVSGWTDIVAISAGNWHTVGLKSDGTVVAVGWNKHSQCDVSGWTDIIVVDAGAFHTVGLKSDGTVVAVGSNNNGECNVSAWTDIAAISAGGDHTVGLKSDGTVVAVGLNCYGQCNVSAWTDIVAISAGHWHTVGLKSDGTVVAVGSNNNGECNVSAWTDIAAISADSYTVGLKADGTVVAVGDNYYGQCDVSDWSNIKVP